MSNLLSRENGEEFKNKEWKNCGKEFESIRDAKFALSKVRDWTNVAHSGHRDDAEKICD